MKEKSFSEIVAFYKKRFAYHQGIINEEIYPETKAIIVIPCFNELDLVSTLQSLDDCTPSVGLNEVIVIINASNKAQNEILQQNQDSYNQAIEWVKTKENPSLQFNILNFNELPPKKAGVGLARKIGMDEALIRFEKINYDGAIVCLDADCKVSDNYLIELESQFILTNKNLGHFYYEHQFEEIENQSLKDGIINYELFLRFYAKALEYTGFPYAIQTVGSCMIVRASVYALQGGMNKRKAGEDFYFMHKVIPHANFHEINNATVYPASRVSDRVPFGTGKAQQDWLDGNSSIINTYDFRIFEDLKCFLEQKDEFYREQSLTTIENLLKDLPDSIQSFLEENAFSEKLKKINNNSTSLKGYNKKFFEWFDGFTVLKYVHFARDNFFNNTPLKEACLETLSRNNFAVEQNYSALELLEIFRKL